MIWSNFFSKSDKTQHSSQAIVHLKTNLHSYHNVISYFTASLWWYNSVISIQIIRYCIWGYELEKLMISAAGSLASSQIWCSFKAHFLPIIQIPLNSHVAAVLVIGIPSGFRRDLLYNINYFCYFFSQIGNNMQTFEITYQGIYWFLLITRYPRMVIYS